MMRTKKRKCQWKRVLQSEIFDLPFVNKRVLPDLLLSYYDLNVTLKRCFSYCSMFPKDRSISCSDLAKIWVGEGFILGRGQKEMMEVAGQYFDDLVDKSLLGVFYKAEHGQTRSGEMHELAYGLARFVAGCDGFSSICKNERLDEIPNEARHAFLICKEFNSAKDVALSIRKALHRAKNLRTVKLLTARRLVLPPDLFDGVGSLRVLDMSDSQIHNLPESVRKLRRLRHIFLCYSGIAWLPKTFGPLVHLQTLDAEGCYELQNLPCDLPQLLSLKHLNLGGTDSLEWLPKHIGQLSRLETLGHFIVQDEVGHRIGELQNLNSIGGHLSITNLEKVRNQRDAMASQICEKPKLKSLNLQWTCDEYADGKGTKSIFDCLRPHSNLKMLSICNYPDIMFPKWMLDSSLCNLVKLELLDCNNCEHLPALGKLPLLEHLQMLEFPPVKSIGYEFYGTVENAFPRLETLEISEFLNLEEWLEMDGAMPMLLKLTMTTIMDLGYCRQLKLDSDREDKRKVGARPHGVEIRDLLNMKTRMFGQLFG
ncbi:putative disease resistance protein [Nymphaea thermarum]|nr:putative disease resistance protein [Nymphaea thermarum]